MIELKNVSKVFESGEKQVTAVQDVNLTVEKGDIYGVIGFSGAGKSTLLRCVNLLEKPTTGKVVVNGRDLTAISSTKLREARKKISMVFQHFNLLESKKVYDNIAFPLRLAGEDKPTIKNRVDQLLEFVGLSEQAEKYPDQLSGGQKQRVGIARALATSPDILLCDEATSALDPQTTASILELLKRINREYKITILIITHEMQVIRDVCQKVAVMENGKIIEQGSIFDVFSNPQTKTAQNFVSSVMNDRIPKSILHLLENDSRHIYRVTFVGDSTGYPLLSQVAKRFHVEVNVLHGQITELQDIPFGNLIIELQGKEDEIRRAQLYINQSVQLQEVLADAN
ncbi:D-methionine transport system ATP-binding protein [Salinibacillus kushneri]|uniref:D-methionine transport system ATP-binding protein n=1 Tax=Salinibacillus kushneri TaxID=237682 RepID=A0A1I0AF48_9BACI|nr:methionine ABC transporter ATP-binding protein [Salinibacillus kushneri]SES92833.1 D-methionine transport system ATP-binding protein [Salinibacillus kushneri]